ARATHAVIMRISSTMLPQHTAYFSDGSTRNHRSWPTPRPSWAVFALLKTRNRLMDSTTDTFPQLVPAERLDVSLRIIASGKRCVQWVAYDMFLMSGHFSKVTSSQGIRLHASLGVCDLQTRRLLVSTIISWIWCRGHMAISAK